MVARSLACCSLARLPSTDGKNPLANVCVLKCCSQVASIFLIRVTFVWWRKNKSPFGTHFVASSQAHVADHKSSENVNVTVNVASTVCNSSFPLLSIVALQLAAGVPVAFPCHNLLRKNVATTLWQMRCMRLQITLQRGATSKQQQTDDNLLAPTTTTFTASNVYVVTLSVFTPANCHLT